MPSRTLLTKLSRVSASSSTLVLSTPLRLPTQPLLPLITPKRHFNHGILILQPSFWRQLTPRAWRSSPEDPIDPDAPAVAPAPKAKSKAWNPATFFILIGMGIGSMAVNMIIERHSSSEFSKKADARIARLKEALRRVQNGEAVDVERVLGTGDAEQEREWEEVVREIRSVDVPKSGKDIKEEVDRIKGRDGSGDEDAAEKAKAVREFY